MIWYELFVVNYINTQFQYFSVNSLTRKGLHKESFNSIFSYGLKYYARQLLKQCHVSIFNLDVLENIYEMDEIDKDNLSIDVNRKLFILQHIMPITIVILNFSYYRNT